VRIKATLFQHDTDHSLDLVADGGGPPAYNDLVVNGGKEHRRGIEVDLGTDPIYNLSLEASGTYLDWSKDGSNASLEYSSCNLILFYNNPDILTARFGGHYEHAKYEDSDAEMDYITYLDDIIWDLSIIKPFTFGKNMSAKFFATAHNLFGGDQYRSEDTKNPGCWLEGGIQLAF
jgi:hypothetical protein